ncbi:hypothetical protein [Hydrogenimonas sp.]
MKIAVPAKNENLQIFIRVAHAPFFAIFENDRFEGFHIGHHAASERDAL